MAAFVASVAHPHAHPPPPPAQPQPFLPPPSAVGTAQYPPLSAPVGNTVPTYLSLPPAQPVALPVAPPGAQVVKPVPPPPAPTNASSSPSTNTSPAPLTPLHIAAYALQPWCWRTSRPPASIARVTLRNNFVALSIVGVAWYLGIWGLLWEVVGNLAGEGTEMVLKRLLLLSLLANIAESAYTLSYPPPLSEPLAGTVPSYKPSSLSPAHRKLIERSLSDLPQTSSSPFFSPSRSSLSRSSSLSFSRSPHSLRSSSLPSSVSFSSSLASTLRSADLSDPL
ncbi:hypothetical protein DACRYDRAFT_21289, partial [Dacryopinax primogenitus]